MGTSLMKYHGGKTKLAAWIIGQMPAHKCYGELYGGMMSVLLNKQPAKTEIYNDLNGEVVNVFRMIRERGEEFAHKVNMTLYAREELDLAYEWTDDPLEQARRFLVRAEMSIKSTSMQKNDGFRTTINSKDYCSQFFTFYKRPDVILKVRDRLAKVAIENTDALKLLKQMDNKHTLFYLDPPYLNATRGAKSVKRGYSHNLTDEQHEQLLDKCNQLQGMAMISGYDNPLYNDLLKHWRREETIAYDDAKKARKEVLWMNFEPQSQYKLDL
jgi:DNA adenine methylase